VDDARRFDLAQHVPAPVTYLDEMRRPIVTLSVKSDDASPFVHEITCHIDTGADLGLVLRSNQRAGQLGLSISDRTAIVADPEAQFEMADGSLVEYMIDFLFITEWVDGKSRWVKVFIPPSEQEDATRNLRQTPADAAGYRRADALLGLELIRSAAFRLNHSQEIVEPLPSR
jgi:hypothetical protein